MSTAGGAPREVRWNSITWMDSRGPICMRRTASGSSAVPTISMQRRRSTDGLSWNERDPRHVSTRPRWGSARGLPVREVLSRLDVIEPRRLADEHVDVFHRRVDRLVHDARDLPRQCPLLLFAA